MLFSFLKKQKEKTHKMEIIRTLIGELNISDDQKEMYVKALDILEIHQLDDLYDEIVIYTQKFEMKQVEDIQKESFVSVAGMKHKEAKEKQKDVNAFSFLLNNI